MADDKLPSRRSASMTATRSDTVMSRPMAISLTAVQNASSRQTLVRWPAITTERFSTRDFFAPYLVFICRPLLPTRLLGFRIALKHDVVACAYLPRLLRTLPARPSRATARGTGLDSRDQTRWLPPASTTRGRTGAAVHPEWSRLD